MFCAAQANWVEMVMQAQWIMAGDKGTTLFYKTFKSLAATREIHELFDTKGNVKNSWEDLAALTTDFFSKALGGAPGSPAHELNPLLLEKVLSVQSERVLLEDKEELNAPISLVELGEAVLYLANDKCPGPDGTLIEFYKANWLMVGPLVHTSIVKCIADEHFLAFFTKGAIVLLKKKDDQRLLGNKRPITLLNSIYKIRPKAMQRRLSPILQKIISPQQLTFLPGCNKHHNLLLVSEMLHQAQACEEEHILLKLDVCKGFDRLEWSFVLASVEKAGLARTLSPFLKAGFNSASLVILLNGRLIEAFKLSRFVQQGCPLSPLVFILAFDILCLMINDEVKRRALARVEFPGSRVHNVQSIFANDVALVIKAIMCYIVECQRLLTVLGAVSGLHFIWEKMIAAFIPGGPPPT